jgi:hypothetical protein
MSLPHPLRQRDLLLADLDGRGLNALRGINAEELRAVPLAFTSTSTLRARRQPSPSPGSALEAFDARV